MSGLNHESRIFAPEPLGMHRLFKTHDVDEARDIVGRHFCTHQLIPTAQYRNFEACHNRAAGKSISLNYLRYTSETSINPGELDQFYLVQLPMYGSADVVHGGRSIAASNQIGSLLNPTRHTHMTWHAGCEKLLLQIDRKRLHVLAESWIGQSLNEAIIFDPEIVLKHPEIHAWYARVWESVRCAESNIAFSPQHSRFQALIEEDLILGLLLAQQNTLTHLVEEYRYAPLNSQLKRARSYIHDNLSESLTLEKIASEAGCSIRSLQVGFKRHFECSPMRYVGERRLKLAHYLLQSLTPDTKVSTVAYDCGFSHLGRFAQAYKCAYGQTPSETLAHDPCRSSIDKSSIEMYK